MSAGIAIIVLTLAAVAILAIVGLGWDTVSDPDPYADATTELVVADTWDEDPSDEPWETASAWNALEKSLGVD